MCSFFSLVKLLAGHFYLLDVTRSFTRDPFTTLVLNLIGGIEPQKFRMGIYRTLRRWKIKMRVVNFIFFTLIVKNLQVTNHCCSTIIICSCKKKSRSCFLSQYIYRFISKGFFISNYPTIRYLIIAKYIIDNLDYTLCICIYNKLCFIKACSYS